MGKYKNEKLDKSRVLMVKRWGYIRIFLNENFFGQIYACPE